jgi:FkbM family methyltransferase
LIKNYREKVSIAIALKSSWKRTYIVPVATEIAPAGSDMIIMRSDGKMKRVLRRLASFGKRLLRPLALPVAFRARRFFVEEMRQELLSELRRNAQQMSDEMSRSFQESENATRQKTNSIWAKIGATNDAISEQIRNVQSNLQRIEENAALGARRFALNSGPDNVLIKTNVGYVLCSSTDHALVATLLEQGELEPGTRLLIERFLAPGDTFVDVGANIGLHTLAAARAMDGRGQIVAFEPYGPTKRLLDRTLWFNGFSSISSVHESAASNRTGVAEFFLGQTSGHHSLYPLNATGAYPATSVEVKLVTLDGVLGPNYGSVSLIKIDVEGAELETLEGALSTIDTNLDIALIVEFGPSHLRRSGITSTEWISRFNDRGLVFRAIHPETGALSDLPLAQLEAADSTNLFFARNGSPAWDKAGALK